MPPEEPIWYDAPAPGDIVWCRFPQDGVPAPGPKARPAPVLNVGETDNHPVVIVADGTSQKIDDLRAGEFAILPANAAGYTAAGLSYPTKFNLGRTFELDYNDVCAYSEATRKSMASESLPQELSAAPPFGPAAGIFSIRTTTARRAPAA